LDERKNEFVFIGDSPNDVPMFSYFPHSVGVANVNDFAESLLPLRPAYVTDARSGEGFIELADALLNAKI
jgi:hydroxymethylpyrimidine pyrophosphatase-like HAD family hydrolase